MIGLEALEKNAVHRQSVKSINEFCSFIKMEVKLLGEVKETVVPFLKELRKRKESLMNSLLEKKKELLRKTKPTYLNENMHERLKVRIFMTEDEINKEVQKELNNLKERKVDTTNNTQLETKVTIKKSTIKILKAAKTKINKVAKKTSLLLTSIGNSTDFQENFVKTMSGKFGSSKWFQKNELPKLRIETTSTDQELEEPEIKPMKKSVRVSNRTSRAIVGNLNLTKTLDNFNSSMFDSGLINLPFFSMR